MSMSKCPAYEEIKKRSDNNTGTVSCRLPHPTIDELLTCSLQYKDLDH
jgi:hypothetical protein